MQETQLCEMLANLGLNNYEAKSYLALLRMGSGSGYGVAKNAAIPTSKVYEALKSLAAKGFITADGMTSPQYRPVPPREVIDGCRDEFIGRLDRMTPQLENLFQRKFDTFTAQLLSGPEKVTGELTELLASTRNKLLLTAWPEQLAPISAELASLAARTEVFILAYGDFSLPEAKVFRHRRPDLVAKEISGRMLLAAADGSRSLIASYRENGAEGITSSQPGIAAIVADHILHDISLNQLIARLPEAQAAEAEKELTQLRGQLYFD